MSKKLKISGPATGAGIVISTVDPYQPQPPDHEKRQRFMKGAGRLIGQLEQERGTEHAQPKREALEKLGEVHNELLIFEELIAQKLPDHVSPAANKAGKALFKLLGRDCFETEAQAAAWARKSLPLTAAWKAAERDATERGRANRDHQRVRRDFWERAAALAGGVTRHSSVGGCLDLGRAIDEVLLAGRWA
ncbi:MAG: hypothetical protein PHO14_10195 [Kiritimatiellae bacterium]|jgi:hypothetical protein|nr:hypothetical protein [Kiritimatiellia bacterium]MDD4342583.1 hypothetical protein [Kiritimatiellia bacterium]